jgi:hypothetical protein
MAGLAGRDRKQAIYGVILKNAIDNAEVAFK